MYDCMYVSQRERLHDKIDFVIELDSVNSLTHLLWSFWPCSWKLLKGLKGLKLVSTHKQTQLQNLLCTKAEERVTSKHLTTNFHLHFHFDLIKCTQALCYSSHTRGVNLCVCVLWTWSHNLLIASWRRGFLLMALTAGAVDLPPGERMVTVHCWTVCVCVCLYLYVCPWVYRLWKCLWKQCYDIF